MAWGQLQTPMLSMAQLCSITGKNQSTLYHHMVTLRRWNTLRLYSTGDDTFIVTFKDDEDIIPIEPEPWNSNTGYLEFRVLDSKNLESKDLDSTNLESDPRNASTIASAKRPP